MVDTVVRSGEGGGRRVVILMGTHNGARHLREQLESIHRQTHQNWRLLVSDDASSDDTLSILDDFAASNGRDRVRVRSGPCRGFVANFLSLAADPGEDADYFAFSDQDDVWHENKLQRALEMLEAVPDSRDSPMLYCGRTRLVSESLRPLGESRLSRQKPCFSNALVQSIAGANTMVFNDAARHLVGAAACSDFLPASHDWWSYLAVTGAEGRVLYDSCPTIDYRQHNANVQGDNRGLRARARRFRQLFEGRLRSWNAAHLHSLGLIQGALSERNRVLLRAFAEVHAAGGARAWVRLMQTGIRRNSVADNLALQLAALAGRL